MRQDRDAAVRVHEAHPIIAFVPVARRARRVRAPALRISIAVVGVVGALIAPSTPGYGHDVRSQFVEAKDEVASTATSPTTSPANTRTGAGKTESGAARAAWAASASPAFRRATKAESGAARSYIDITKGGSIRNVGTDATHTEFGGSLTKGGWAAKTSQDGRVQVFQKDGAKYVLRERAGSHGGWTADFTPSGASDVALKIRLGYKP